MFDTSSLIDVAKGLLGDKGEIRNLFERLEGLVSQDKIKVVYTHIQIDEIKDEDERRTINEFFEELKAELIPTRIAVVGFSRVDMCKSGGKSEHQLYEKLKTFRSKENWIKDLIQTLTSFEINILVTNERGIRHAIRQIKTKSEQMNCEAFRLDEFQKLLETLN